MKRSLAILAACLLLTALAAAEPQASQRQMESSFQPGSNLALHLGGGDYRIRAGSGDKIVVTYSTRSEDQLNKVKVEVRSHSNGSELWVSGPHKDFQVTIEIPAHTNLWVRQSAGDLEVKGIEGDKDIENHVGDVKLDVTDPAAYGLVDASVHIGDLNASPFGNPKGWLGGKLRTQGTGPYRLHAHVDVGDLDLYASKAD
ncbi:MAG TPA: hypothetical protein VLT85_12770 [Terriglobales bacterium]|nr:hypothetical protein [Terriglobales bacterium]